MGQTKSIKSVVMIFQLKKKYRLPLLLLMVTTELTFGQGAFDLKDKTQETQPLASQELNITPLIQGTLLLPESHQRPNLVLIIPGSGPTDRNGNQPMMSNNSLKYLAQGLQQRGIASFRYDKRVIPLMRQGDFQEQEVQFNDFIEDARQVLRFFRNKDNFNKIFILGHSQGSLVGMVAAHDGCDGFISVAGAGQSIDRVVLDQLSLQLPGAVPGAAEAFNTLKQTGRVDNFPQELSTIFRPSIQSFMYQWMSYDPAAILASLPIPSLILNGTSDLQVSEQEALRLKKNAPNAEFSLILNMNHVLKIIEEKGLANGKSYNDPNLPVSEELLEKITEFVNKNSSKSP